MNKPPTSPTGYWAILLHTDEHLEALTEAVHRIAKERGESPVKPRGVEILPVVTWSASGWAAVFDHNGMLQPVNEIKTAQVIVTSDPTDFA